VVMHENSGKILRNEHYRAKFANDSVCVYEGGPLLMLSSLGGFW
jgi:hypothetical protein